LSNNRQHMNGRVQPRASDEAFPQHHETRRNAGRPREKSLSPFSKRLALTQAMNMGTWRRPNDFDIGIWIIIKIVLVEKTQEKPYPTYRTSIGSIRGYHTFSRAYYIMGWLVLGIGQGKAQLIWFLMYATRNSNRATRQ
jgi:hypothetical protein